VKVTNAKDVLELASVDGVLVGSAALYLDHFCSMIDDADEIEKRVGEK
jgi:triosephosphate isomerase